MTNNSDIQTFNEFNEKCQNRIEQFIQQHLIQLKQHAESLLLLEAIEYMLLNGGKRLRPLLVYSVGHCLGAQWEQLDNAAASIEYIHTYSLIHDDLPAMDNDDFRRGKPSCHRAFNEAIAILAGDTLQTLAFELLTEKNKFLSNEQLLNMIKTLAKYSGIEGIASGQALDLAYPRAELTSALIKKINNLKTAALFKGCVEMAFFAADFNISAHQKLHQALIEYAELFGLAYQARDDIEDHHPNDVQAIKHLDYLVAETLNHLTRIPFDMHFVAEFTKKTLSLTK